MIRYEATADLSDPVALLQRRLFSGKTALSWDAQRGYLPALLHALRVPISSQSLVFSKTSSQRDHTSPKTPRAIYFSDNVSVGWTPDSPTIDILAVDPDRGPIFYTLDQRREKSAAFKRDAECMQCHLGGKTLHVPGLLVRSVYADSQGMPLAKVGDFINGHNSPLRERWGGWFVTGTHENELHLGNIFATNPDDPQSIDLSAGANVTDLTGRFDHSRYLAPGSDIVALLVLEHQVRMQNLLTRANYETRLALDDEQSMAQATQKAVTAADAAAWRQERVAIAAEALLQYMLFRDEAPLTGRVRGTSGFAREFAAAGPFDAGGRSLRQFDLETRLFRFPCSYLIYSPAFEALPSQMKTCLWQRLEQALTGHDQTPAYAGMSPSDRGNVLQILQETKPEFARFLAQVQAAR